LKRVLRPQSGGLLMMEKYDMYVIQRKILMTHRTTVTITDEAFAFLQTQAGRNRSAYINQLLQAERQRLLAAAIAVANREEAEEAYQEDLLPWTAALSDGLRG
jgi:antitoxin CcdA